MTGPIWNRRTSALLLLTWVAAFLITPAMAVAGSERDLGIDGYGAPVPIPDSIADPTLKSVAVHRPDGRIREAGHGYPGRYTPETLPFVGNNVYNTNAARQNATVESFSLLEGTYFLFDISIQNDGNRADRFKIRSTGTTVNGWLVRYYRGTTDISAAVVAGTYQTPSLAPGATYLIRAKMTNEGRDTTRLVTIKSTTEPTKVDAVRFGYRTGACGC